MDSSTSDQVVLPPNIVLTAREQRVLDRANARGPSQCFYLSILEIIRDMSVVSDELRDVAESKKSPRGALKEGADRPAPGAQNGGERRTAEFTDLLDEFEDMVDTAERTGFCSPLDVLSQTQGILRLVRAKIAQQAVAARSLARD